MKTILAIGIFTCATLTSAPAQAETPIPGFDKPRGKVLVVPYKDRDETTTSTFVNKDGRFVLRLAKTSGANGGSPSGAHIMGVNNINGKSIHIDYDISADSWQSATSPRVVVSTKDGKQYPFRVADGTHTALSDGWTHIRYSHHSTDPSIPHESLITRIDFVFDDGTDVTGGASAFIDNVAICDVAAGEKAKK